jgi:CDP-glucose 4,6-dehydratase
MTQEAFSWRGKRVLVTGCTGFLGGAVSRELFSLGAEVVGLIHERTGSDIFGPQQTGRVHFVRGRADNIFRLHSAMAVHEVAAVFHLCAKEPFGEDRTTHAVLEATKLYSRGVPVVAARPLQQLAIARMQTDPHEGLSVARFGEVFGPGDRKVFRVAPASAIALQTGEPLRLPAEGAATDFVFVRDAARALIRVAEDTATHGPGDYPFRSGWLMSERQMAVALRDVFADREPVLPEIAPVANPLNWSPTQSFAAAARETLAWYRDFAQAGFTTTIRAVA